MSYSNEAAQQIVGDCPVLADLTPAHVEFMQQSLAQKNLNPVQAVCMLAMQVGNLKSELLQQQVTVVEMAAQYNQIQQQLAATQQQAQAAETACTKAMLESGKHCTKADGVRNMLDRAQGQLTTELAKSVKYRNKIDKLHAALLALHQENTKRRPDNSQLSKATTDLLTAMGSIDGKKMSLKAYKIRRFQVMLMGKAKETVGAAFHGRADWANNAKSFEAFAKIVRMLLPRDKLPRMYFKEFMDLKYVCGTHAAGTIIGEYRRLMAMLGDMVLEQLSCAHFRTVVHPAVTLGGNAQFNAAYKAKDFEGMVAAVAANKASKEYSMPVVTRPSFAEALPSFAVPHQVEEYAGEPMDIGAVTARYPGQHQRLPLVAPPQQSQPRPPAACWMCGKIGHTARRCPERQESGNGGQA
ncbi:hypothetical protein H9P43_002917 [Blastocladiella emersonii ATCC 22665]|nr:hypothetical protein H9P43_002917 [Blastocladiella emersonii ATCC 22665]